MFNSVYFRYTNYCLCLRLKLMLLYRVFRLHNYAVWQLWIEASLKLGQSKKNAEPNKWSDDLSSNKYPFIKVLYMNWMSFRTIQFHFMSLHLCVYVAILS